ncbi:MAG TPA: hypothetical protein VH877_27690 [Polyangia bacterium]|nr:hypothetical protein [Polyangia bacterium]
MPSTGRLIQLDIDALYQEFVETLPVEDRPMAQQLAYVLGLAPVVDLPWSRVFADGPVLHLPWFFADAMPSIGATTLVNAVHAHLLGVIAAFAADRIQDGQLRRPPAKLLRVVNALRIRRDNVLERLGEAPADAQHDFALGEWDTAVAVIEEHRLLGRGGAVDLATYERIALDKSAMAFPASLRLAHAAGWNEEQLGLVRQAISGVILTLQMQDDAADWDEDLQRGVSWAACLSAGATDRAVSESIDQTRCRVLTSGVLARLLARARSHADGVRSAAEALGASSLVQWAAEMVAVLTVLVRREGERPGYAAQWYAQRASTLDAYVIGEDAMAALGLRRSAATSLSLPGASLG